MKTKALKSFWNDRFECFGHTGWRIAPLYAYDQQIRMKTVSKILQKICFVIDESKTILDIGCGSGDFIKIFADKNANVMGFDLSNSVVESTSKRFINYKNVKIWCSDIVNANLSTNHFDLVTSITVLQHVISDEELVISLNQISDSMKDNGYFLLIESVAKDSRGEADTFYMKPRPRDQWLSFFRNANLHVVKETSYPHLALSLLQLLNRLTRRGRQSISRRSVVDARSAEEGAVSGKMHSRLIGVFLTLLRPIDYWCFLPIPKKFAKRRVFLLIKKSREPEATLDCPGKRPDRSGPWRTP